MRSRNFRIFAMRWWPRFSRHPVIERSDLRSRFSLFPPTQCYSVRRHRIRHQESCRRRWHLMIATPTPSYAMLALTDCLLYVILGLLFYIAMCSHYFRVQTHHQHHHHHHHHHHPVLWNNWNTGNRNAYMKYIACNLYLIFCLFFSEHNSKRKIRKWSNLAYSTNDMVLGFQGDRWGLSPVSIQTQSLALRKRKPQVTQALALASSQSWLPLLRPSIPIG